jgi:hypothetical protein
MRQTRIAIALATATLSLAGCAAFGLDEPSAGDAAKAADGKQWIVVDAGKATPSPGETTGKPAVTPEVSLSPPAPDPSCTKIWPRTEPVMIPVEVTPGAGSLTVEWPTQGLSDYRIAAVLQDLVAGPQPEPEWITVPPGKGCSVSATISGLVPDEAYIVWLDAPNTGRERDGTRRLYSGRSGVVYPQ